MLHAWKYREVTSQELRHHPTRSATVPQSLPVAEAPGKTPCVSLRGEAQSKIPPPMAIALKVMFLEAFNEHEQKQLLARMCQQEVLPDVIAFSSAAHACGVHGRWQQAFALMDRLRRFLGINL